MPLIVATLFKRLEEQAGRNDIMVQAIVYFDTTDGAGFESVLTEFGPRIVSADGYLDHSLRRGVENPDRYLLSVMWESVEDHTNWQQANGPDFLEALGPYIVGPPDIKHFQ
jgi:quinol monooxygenase YgiN